MVIELRNDPLVHSTVSAKLISETAATIEWVQSHANELKVPLLLAQGTSDTLNPSTYVNQFFLG